MTGDGEEPNPNDGPKKVGRAKKRRHDEVESPATVETWVYAFMLSGNTIRGLAPKTKVGRAPRSSTLHTDIQKAIEKVLDDYKAKPGQGKTKRGTSSGYNTVRDIHLTVVSRVSELNTKREKQGEDELPLPSYDAVRDRIYASPQATLILKRPPADRLEAHKGAMVRAGVKVVRIMQRVELDDTWLDLIVVDEVRNLPLGRPNLTLAVDAFLGIPGGKYVGYEKSSSNAARQCTLDLILPKPYYPTLYGTKHTLDIYGIPELLDTDGGPGFNSADMYTSCAEAGIAFELLPVQTAWLKPHVERFFGSTDVSLLKRLPGSTFSNVLERGGYDPSKWACISLTGFLEMLHIFLVDHLPSQWHEGLECYPRDRLEAQLQIYEPVLNHSADELRRIFSRTEDRMIHDYGIELETIRYNSAALQGLRARLPDDAKVRFKVDDYNLSQIDVLDVTNPAAQSWLPPVPAVDLEYTKDLSLWSHRIIRRNVNAVKAAGEQASLRELAEAKERLQNIVRREFLTTRSTRRRQEAQRFLDETGFGEQPGGLRVTASSVAHERAARWGNGKGEGSPALLALPAPIAALPAPTSEAFPAPDKVAAEVVGSDPGANVPEKVEIVQFPTPSAGAQPAAPTRRTGDYGLPGRTGGPRPIRGGQ